MMLPFRYSTGIHRTLTTVEWVVLRKSRRGVEKVREGSVPLPENFSSAAGAPLFPADVLSEIRREFRGTVTVALPSSLLLMRVLNLPAVDAAELRDMVELQMDGISPFPSDQLTISYEVFHQSEDHSRILAVAAPRKTVDELGELFKTQNVYIRSLDAEILAWWTICRRSDSEFPTSESGRTLLILKGHTEFSMAITDAGVPVTFRSLELFRNLNDAETQDEIIDEISYTLLSLETEYGSRPVERILFGYEEEIPETLMEKIAARFAVPVEPRRLNGFPPLAEGLARRSLDKTVHHAELVPSEWIEIQQRRKMMRIGTVAAATVLGIWVLTVIIASTVFSIRESGLRRMREDAARYAAPARVAQTAREEMLSLEKFADRSHSALETLREVTVALTDGVELASFTFKKGESVSLRGSSDRAELIYDFFQDLGKSELFTGVKDQPVSTRLVKERRVSTFSITADLPPAASGTEAQQ